MSVRNPSVLLLLLAACATPEPTLRDQIAIPWGPVVAPKPVTLPAPLALPPPAPLVVLPEQQIRELRPDAQVAPAAESPDSPQQEPEATPEPAPDKSAPNKGPPPALTTERRPECEPQPMPHLGGDELHNWCADTIPPNRFPGHDVLVNGKRFDALQVGVRVLWEIKTDRFDEYSLFLKEQVIRKQISELQRERELARACGYDFVVGVSSAEHLAALFDADATLKLVITGC